MKKISLLAIIFGLFLSLNVSAQIKVPKDENALTHEQKMLPFALGMSLSVMGEMHDENYLAALNMFQKQIRNWSAELKPVVEMSKDISVYNRLDIAQTASKSIYTKSNDSDKWQMLIGDYFGNIYVQIKKNKVNGDQINEHDLKFNIEMIGILANKTPNDIPWHVTNKLKDFAKIKDSKNLTSDKNIKKITESVMNILTTISK